MNVALGGTLHQAVQEVPGMIDHRDNPELRWTSSMAPRTRAIAPGGMLRRCWAPTEIMVNSLHGQGVNQLAPGLVVEAVADDGLVEALRSATAPGFTLAVQWHPEWRITTTRFDEDVRRLRQGLPRLPRQQKGARMTALNEGLGRGHPVAPLFSPSLCKSAPPVLMRLRHPRLQE
jgi:GMP synthase-like glutamine amidotransferase